MIRFCNIIHRDVLKNLVLMPHLKRFKNEHGAYMQCSDGVIVYKNQEILQGFGWKVRHCLVEEIA